MYATYGPENSDYFVVLAPGDAGRLEDTGLTLISNGLANAGIRVIRFEFPFCESNDSEIRDKLLADEIRKAAAKKKTGQTLVLGGQSRGARVSAGLVHELKARALVGFAYPFHARSDPHPHGRERELAELNLPVLICQGTRDSHGNREQVASYRLPKNIRLLWLEDANHALHPRARSNTNQEEQLKNASIVAGEFICSLV